MPDVTQLLGAMSRGETRAAGQLLPLVYEELRRLAAAKLAHERPGHTLDATALVHEAYLRLVGSSPDEASPQHNEASPQRKLGVDYATREFANRRHFFAAAAEAMRRILVENARRRDSLKRGGGQVRQDVEELELAAPEPREDLLAIDEALETLAATDKQAAELVQLRYFAGFTLLDAAEVLGVSPHAAHRLWAYARAYLHRALQP